MASPANVMATWMDEMNRVGFSWMAATRAARLLP
jgi:hypothetical protein